MFLLFVLTMQAKVCEDMFAGFAKECQIEVWMEFWLVPVYDYRNKYIFPPKANCQF